MNRQVNKLMQYRGLPRTDQFNWLIGWVERIPMSEVDVGSLNNFLLHLKHLFSHMRTVFVSRRRIIKDRANILDGQLNYTT